MGSAQCRLVMHRAVCYVLSFAQVALTGTLHKLELSTISLSYVTSIYDKSKSCMPIGDVEDLLWVAMH